MIKYPVYNLDGKKVKEIELADAIFGLPRNDALLHQVYVAQYANRRPVIAHAKDRSERAGTGKKPWRQKGTGRARVGSVRSPIWRKGGVIFGPTKDRNFKKDIPKKMNRKAFITALSAKVQEEKIMIVEALRLEEAKTRLAKEALGRLKIKGSILIAFSKSEREIKRAVKNLPEVDYIEISNLNVLDILNHKNLLVSEEGIKNLQERPCPGAKKERSGKK